uniref:Receptor ligand binding region domain-containing protein n=1 Tax=Ananas comosus var. bracteatus TaxID=296719 RepID=A0A6V7PNA3_ANACO|nr:unnamed protein product [Ananas comosus var. bracteatus]
MAVLTQDTNCSGFLGTIEDADAINYLLVQVNLMESRVYVVHVNPDSGLTVFSQAKRLGMMAAGYVWMATDWLASVLDSSAWLILIHESYTGINSGRRIRGSINNASSTSETADLSLSADTLEMI